MVRGQFRAPIYVLANQTDKQNSPVRETDAFQFRILEPTDGMALHRLVRDCPPLDQNSSYCNLLQCSHFKNTSIAAFRNNVLLGSITAYCIPDRPDTVFVWQVAVHQSARGQGLARTMLRKLATRLAAENITYVETSITPSNEASVKLFTGFAAEQHAKMVRTVMFDHVLHFEGGHDTEHLYRIGPLQNANTQ
jgi:L-2,4-diaminobutyric acid acetyltransferase